MEKRQPNLVEKKCVPPAYGLNRFGFSIGRYIFKSTLYILQINVYIKPTLGKFTFTVNGETSSSNQSNPKPTVQMNS